MKKIAVLSFNSVVRDSRILKSADSIASPDREVTIFGFEDNHVKDGYARLRDSGVKLELIPRGFSAGILGFIYENYRGVLEKLYLSLKANRWYLLIAVSLFFLFFLYYSPSSVLNLTVAVIVSILFLALFIVIRYRKFLIALIAKLLLNMISMTRKKLWDEHRTEALYKKALEYNPDIIHAHDLRTMDAAVSLKKKIGASLIWDAHEIYEEVAQLDTDTKENVSKKINKFQADVDYFITINESISDYYREKYPSLPKAIIIKNASKKVGKTYYDGRLHKASCLPLNQKIILYQGGFARKRGLENLVKASEYFSNDRTLVMMGWGGLTKTLHEISHDINTRIQREIPAVIFIPPAPQEELYKWSAGAFVGLIPYEKHGLNHLYCTPNKLWEYPNSGVPILCTPMVEMKKVVIKWNVGWLLDEILTPEVIASKVNAITDEEQKEKRLNCYRYIESDNWDAYSQKLALMYKGMS